MALKLGPQREWVKKLASSNCVVPLIEQAIDRLGEFEWEASFAAKASDDAWHPSGDCTPSLLDLYLKATGQAEYRSIGVGLRKTFMVGHFWHAYLQAVLVQAELAAPAQIEQRGMFGWGPVEARHFDHIGDIPWSPWHWSTGSIDVADMHIPAVNAPAVVDFKTMKPTDFSRNDPPAWTADKWECQLNVYMDWTHTEHAFVVGIDKASGEFKEFHYERNQDLIDAIYLKWHLVAECLVEEITPPEDEDVPLPLRGPK
jgi:hypothetical protein